MFLHTNVEVLVWKPPRLEVLASEIGALYTVFVPQGGEDVMTWSVIQANCESHEPFLDKSAK
jgi:hypothetical protein